MSFNPLEHKGIPLEKQLRNWSELTSYQYDKNTVHPYTRCRVIAMNGVEVEAAMFKHHMHRMTPDMDMRRRLSMSRRIEQQQQKAINGLIPGNESTLENTIGYEQVAVDLTAWCARNEPDQYLKQAYDFGLLEDFDHLYRYADMLDLLEGKQAETIVGKLTEITPGRPTISEHRHPFDDVRRWSPAETADVLSHMNVMSLVAAEQQTMNFYMNQANRSENSTLRGLYTEIGMIEEQHVTHYGSLIDPSRDPLIMMLLHEYHECYLYHSFMEQEPDEKIRRIFEMHLDMEIGHLHDAIDCVQTFLKADAYEVLPTFLPQPTTFESNIDYVRTILSMQLNLTGKNEGFVPVDTLSNDDRFYLYQQSVNSDGRTEQIVPTEKVIQEHISAKGQDYRFEVREHPIESFRDRKHVPPAMAPISPGKSF